MNLVDIILIAVLAAVLFFAVRGAVRGRGCCGDGAACGGNCSQCRSAAGCSKTKK